MITLTRCPTSDARRCLLCSGTTSCSSRTLPRSTRATRVIGAILLTGHDNPNHLLPYLYAYIYIYIYIMCSVSIFITKDFANIYLTRYINYSSHEPSSKPLVSFITLIALITLVIILRSLTRSKNQ